jgi:hypothetical protein
MDMQAAVFCAKAGSAARASLAEIARRKPLTGPTGGRTISLHNTHC